MKINKKCTREYRENRKTSYINKNNSNNEQKRSREKQDRREKTTKRKNPMRNNEKQNDTITKVGDPHLMIIKRTIHSTGKKKKERTHTYDYVNRSQRHNVTSDDAKTN